MSGDRAGTGPIRTICAEVRNSRPRRKGGRERYSVYDGDDEEEMSLSLSKKESVFDYFDDGEESVG